MVGGTGSNSFDRQLLAAEVPPEATKVFAAQRPTADDVVQLLARHHEGAGPFSQARIGHSDDRDLGYRGMAIEHILDLHDRDVLAAADDHVLPATGNGDVAVGIELGEIAGVEPALAVHIVEPTSLAFAEIQEFLRNSGVARSYWPERLALVDALPMTATGKIQKFVLRERASELVEAQEIYPKAEGIR